MTDKIIDLAKYRAKLKADATQVTEDLERELISALSDWFSAKVDDWLTQRDFYASAIKEGIESKSERDIIKDYIKHLKKVGQLLFIHKGIEIIRTNGDGWETDAKATGAVLDHVLQVLSDG